ncbi:MAG: GatB/YqeY domain-containing protein [Alicyclobacillus sp.]|nr:GatB/YqeY domain-containing protein [Alicyclobacillus sp.]
MGLSEQLAEDMKQAMKDKDKVRLSTIRMVRSAIKNREIETGTALADADIVAVIQKELKQRQDSLQAFESAGRSDLADEVREEIRVLQAYLPQPLSEDELRALIQETVAAVGAQSKADIGKVMSALMPQVRGRAEGRLVQQMVQAVLS